MIRIILNSFVAFLIGIGVLFFYSHIQKKEETYEKKVVETEPTIVPAIEPSPIPIVLREDKFEVRNGIPSSNFGPLSVTGILGKKEEKQTVVFSDGKTLNYLGYAIKYVGAIWNNVGGALVLFKKDDCVGCKPVRTLIIYTRNSPNVELLYPGNRDSVAMKNGTIVSLENKVSAFLGNCLESDETVLVWMSSKEQEAKIYSLAADNLLKLNLIPSAAVLQNIQMKVLNKKCTEIQDSKN